jgi:hypothetical protein
MKETSLLLIISLAVSGISFTISVTSIFKWLRELISPLSHKVEELIHCPWCLSHYVTIFFLLFVYDKTIFLDISFWIHIILNWLAIICVSGLCHYVLLRAYDPVRKEMVQRQIDKLKKD